MTGDHEPFSLPASALVGVVSDTHDWIHPRLGDVLEGVDVILHAGDICSSPVIDALEAIAPVIAVQGNNDIGRDTVALPLRRQGTLGPFSVLLQHIVVPPSRRRSTSIPEGVDIVIFGHSHMPYQKSHNGILYLNPGAAGKPRFRSKPTVGLLALDDDDILFEIVHL